MDTLTTNVGEPMLQVFCHCDDCQVASTALASPLILFPAGKITYIKGKEHVNMYNKRGGTERNFCKICGSFLVANVLSFNMQSVPASRLVDWKFRPAFHVMYQYKTVSVKDGLVKYNDFPAGFGGSDVVLEE